MEFTKVQEQIIQMYTALCDEKKNVGTEESVDEIELKDDEEKIKVESLVFVILLPDDSLLTVKLFVLVSVQILNILLKIYFKINARVYCLCSNVFCKAPYRQVICP